jgi:hypothetical protein
MQSNRIISGNPLKGRYIKQIKNENLRSADYAVIPPEILLFSLKRQTLSANINIHTEIYIKLFIALIELYFALS